MPKKPTKKSSIRDRAKKAQTTSKSSKRIIKNTTSKITGTVGKTKSKLSKEFNIPLPNNRLGRFLSKRGRLLPKFITESWGELRDVTWPNKKETYRLTVAVFVFSIVFGLIVALLDIGLDKVFKEIILK